MRIGIFDPYLDDLGGGEKYMITVAECLSKNHQVYIFWDNKKDLEELLKRFTVDLSKVDLTKNIFSKGFGFLKKILESRKYDAIIVLSDGSIPLLLSKKLFIHFQQPFPNIKLSQKTNIKKTRVNSFFSNSNFTKSFVDKEFKINSKVIYPPVGIKAKINEKENIILHVGRFRVKDVTTRVKGIETAIGDYKKQSVMLETFKEMIGKGLKGWKFVLAVSVNDDELKIFEEFKKNAEGYPIEFLINKPNDKLWEVYARAKIYWHASGYGENLTEHPEYAEHFGISTVEAMGAGCVPVVINAGGQKEIVTENKNGFLWDSLEELQDKTLKLIHDQGLLSKFSKQAEEDANKFSKEKFCKEINDLVLQ